MAITKVVGAWPLPDGVTLESENEVISLYSIVRNPLTVVNDTTEYSTTSTTYELKQTYTLDSMTDLSKTYFILASCWIKGAYGWPVYWVKFEIVQRFFDPGINKVNYTEPIAIIELARNTTHYLQAKAGRIVKFDEYHSGVENYPVIKMYMKTRDTDSTAYCKDIVIKFYEVPMVF